MVRKNLEAKNSLNQTLLFDIEEYDEYVVLAKLTSKEIQKIDVPCTFNCKPITVIGSGCFLDCDFMKEVIIPKGVKRIETLAFGFCHLYKPNIILPDGLEVIEELAFSNAGAFELVIPDSVREIGRGAFLWGPHPITKLPYDKAWFSEWPYGENVKCSAGEGKIVDVINTGKLFQVYEVLIGTESKKFFELDYLDGIFFFLDKKNEEMMKHRLDNLSDSELEKGYKIRDNWRRGLI